MNSLNTYSNLEGSPLNLQQKLQAPPLNQSLKSPFLTDFRHDPRFKGIKPFDKKQWLSSPTMHGDEERYIVEAIRTNWVSTVGENIDKIEEEIAALLGVKYAVALSTGTAALHLATRLCAEKIYGPSKIGHGTLEGKRVFCSDMTFDATINPVAYEGGEAIFIDTERDTWNMDSQSLQRAFEIYPDVKLIVIAHLYGTPGKVDEIKRIATAHGALIVEDAAESFGATYKSRQTKQTKQTEQTDKERAGKEQTTDRYTCQTGSFGDIGVISFNGNKIITGSAGAALLCDNKADADKVRKWSTQSREAAPWYQHEELGYNYRMSNLIAGVIRGQLPYLQEHIDQKRRVYERYREGLKDLPLTMNPFDEKLSSPNFWLSCALINDSSMCPAVRGEQEYLYKSERGKSCPQEILEAMSCFNAEGRPIWKPMHLQPMYRMNPFVNRQGSGRGQSNAYIASSGASSGVDVGADIFRRGLCLPSDNKLTAENQEIIIEIIRRCFD